jgi:hypothetical protein
MNRLFLICRECLTQPGIAFRRCSLQLAFSNTPGVWNTVYAHSSLDQFFWEHSHFLDSDIQQFIVITEDSMQPAARTVAGVQLQENLEQ